MPPPFGISVDFLNAAFGINEGYGPPLAPVPGPTGPAGVAGPAGAAGAVGAAGPAGVAGSVGPAGPAGAVGATGSVGPAGPAGAAGAVGPAGADGAAGAVGATGSVGPAGAAGAVGATGSVGPAGPAGPAGADGVAGVAGAIGATGPPGEMGPAGPALYGALYPFPSAIRTGLLTAATRTYLVTYSMVTSATFASTSTFFASVGSDSYRVGIYRGDLSSGVLVGQTSSVAPTSGYNSKTFVLVSGQSLSFTAGSQVSVAYTTAGSTSNPAFVTSGSVNIALATISSTNNTGGFPSLITGVTGQSATGTRICMEMS